VTALQRRIDAHVAARGCESDAGGATLVNGRSPDIVVTCDDRELYRPLESVQEYLIFDSQTRFARLYRRNDTHPERLSMLPDRIAGDVDLQSIGLTVSLDAPYADARIPIRS
jgi:Uma2 family endonuclease